jgi:peroxiredoxin Q/BCP
MKALVSVLLFLSTATLSFGDDMLSIGSPAPEFSLSGHDNDTVSLSSYKGKNYVVLIFYPGDETPVCTQQLCEIRDDYSRFEQRGAVVFGVNPASEKSHQKFVQKHSFQFKLLIDSKGVVAKLYSAKGALMNQRTVYVIDKEGKIVFAKRGKPPVAEILSSIPEQK